MARRYAILMLFGVALAGWLGTAASSMATDPKGLSWGEIVRQALPGLKQHVALVDVRPAEMQVQSAPASSAVDEKKATLEVTLPRNRSEVGMNVIVEGLVRAEDLGDRYPVVGVHPLLTNLTWIQPLPMRVEKKPEGFVFRTRAYCGTKDKGVGEQFEIYVLLPKRGAVKEGDQLDKVPEGIPVSDATVVTRVR